MRRSSPCSRCGRSRRGRGGCAERERPAVVGRAVRPTRGVNEKLPHVRTPHPGPPPQRGEGGGFKPSPLVGEGWVGGRRRVVPTIGTPAGADSSHTPCQSKLRHDLL